MKLIFRPLQYNDWKDIRKWCKDWDFPEIKPLTVSKNGYIVEDWNNNKICACWLYLTSNSQIGWFGFPICNKQVEYDKRDAALDYILTKIKEVAAELGNPILLTTVERESLANRLERLGYEQGDKNVNQYWGFNIKNNKGGY